MTADTPAARLRVALEMADLGEQLVRSRLRRDHPDWTDEQVQAGIDRWRRDRPGALFGDYPGPRSSRVIQGVDR
ncbi:MAG TPA: hypothetical protein GXZ60_02435 [Intrasporangiaceae bacterium]|nr:hypothetical protein [Intrasporangiaceae bacterium]